MRTKLGNRDRKGVLFLKFGVLAGALVLVVLTGLSTAGYGAPSGNSAKGLSPDRIRIFDPFVLSSTVVVLGQSNTSDSVDSQDIRLSADTIRISSRPELRSPFRPPFTPPGPPVGVPGRPVWAPPGKPG
jgi:hypothetical protein